MELSGKNLNHLEDFSVIEHAVVRSFKDDLALRLI